MGYHVYTDEERQKFQDNPEALLNLRKKPESIMASASLFSTFVRGSKAQDVFRNDLEAQMRAKLNDDQLSEKLIPNFPFGCRRPTVRYYCI